MDSMKPYNIFSGNKENSKGRFLRKSSSFNSPVVIINGFNGSGKTLISPIVASLPKVELMSFIYPVEWASALLYSEDLTVDGYKELIKMIIDETIYNQQMSRSVNFRPSDLSSVFKSSKKLTYLKRLLKNGDDAVVPLIKKNDPISCFVTCHLLPIYPTISEALEKRLIFIETVRDPLLMYEQLSILGENILNVKSEKDFTFRAFSGEASRTYLDFYADNEVFKNESKLTKEENLVNYIYRMFEFYFEYRMDKSQFKSKLLFIPFEDFVIKPRDWIKIITDELGVDIDNKTEIEMKKQKVPRELLSKGLKLPIYKKYGAKDLNVSSLAQERSAIISQTKSLFEDLNQFQRLMAISEKYQIWKSSLLGE